MLLLNMHNVNTMQATLTHIIMYFIFLDMGHDHSHDGHSHEGHVHHVGEDHVHGDTGHDHVHDGHIHHHADHEHVAQIDRCDAVEFDAIVQDASGVPLFFKGKCNLYLSV